MNSTEAVAAGFLDALVARDFATLGDHLGAGVRLRALEPAQAVMRSGAEQVSEHWAERLGGWTRCSVMDRSVTAVGSRLQLSYRLGLESSGDHRVVAQTLLVDVDGDRVTAVDLLCSGFVMVRGDH